MNEGVPKVDTRVCWSGPPARSPFGPAVCHWLTVVGPRPARTHDRRLAHREQKSERAVASLGSEVASRRLLASRVPIDHHILCMRLPELLLRQARNTPMRLLRSTRTTHVRRRRSASMYCIDGRRPEP